MPVIVGPSKLWSEVTDGDVLMTKIWIPESGANPMCPYLVLSIGHTGKYSLMRDARLLNLETGSVLKLTVDSCRHVGLLVVAHA